jgi:hypothetical protein
MLVLLNPGATSRNYLIGIARAAERMGILAGALELEPIWRQFASAGPQASAIRAQAARQVAELCAKQGVTHVLGYTHNGVFDFGLFPDPTGAPNPVGLFSSLDIPHLLLWTDHPQWAAQGSALDPQVARVLADPRHFHIVKSLSAAAELRALCAWPRVVATTMGEDYEALTPARSISPLHDVVLIQSDAAALSGASAPFLTDPDPDPRGLLEAHREPTIRAVEAAIAAMNPSPSADQRAAIGSLAREMIDARVGAPLTPWWRIAEPLRERHADAIGWLHADMRRWVTLTSALGSLVGWRRRFWPAWLARHVSVGLYGSPSESMGLVTPPDGAAWVGYARQPEIYARGRIALNINAGHDEEGLTHKPFQIAASGVACVHHDSLGLAEAFAPGDEILPFGGGRALLEAVRELLASDSRRTALAEAMRARARRDHTWDRFLHRVLSAERARAPDPRTVQSPS